MQAPTDFLNLSVRHATEVANSIGAGVQQLSAAFATPPALPGMMALPQGLPALPMGLPALPTMPGAGAPAGAAAKAAVGEIALGLRPAPKIII